MSPLIPVQPIFGCHRISIVCRRGSLWNPSPLIVNPGAEMLLLIFQFLPRISSCTLRSPSSPRASCSSVTLLTNEGVPFFLHPSDSRMSNFFLGSFCICLVLPPPLDALVGRGLFPSRGAAPITFVPGNSMMIPAHRCVVGTIQ